MKPTFFSSPAKWREWLDKHHHTAPELLVGFYKRDSGKPSITWPESVDQALCFGWIDGVRRSIDEISYCIRFTPRRPRSVWSAINIRRVAELAKSGHMHPAGAKAFAARTGDRSGIYAYEQRRGAKLTGKCGQQFRSHKQAWDFFRAQPPWYQRTASWWVISAKKEETRLTRLSQLIKDSENQKTIRQLARPGNKKQ